MEKFYSKIEPKILLHIIKRFNDIKPGRENLIEENQFIQCSALNLDKGTTFKPHKHILKRMSQLVIAQESWIVIKGSVKCIFYDIDNTILSEPILYAGDCSFTLRGGHNYEIFEDNSIIMEYKTGPYLGQEMDKEFI